MTAGSDQPECCGKPSWSAERDLPSARGFEFEVGKCVNCGTPWMHAWCVASSQGGFEPISRAEAEYLKGVAPEELKVLMRVWGDRLG